MKKSFIGIAGLAAAAMVLSASSARAERIGEGTIEAGLSAYIDLDSPAGGSSVDARLSGGYYVMNGVEAGLRLRVYTDDDYCDYGFSAFGEQNIETGTSFIPYVGAEVGLASCDYNDSTTAIVLGVEGGLKVYLSEWTALDLSLHLEVGTDDVFIDDGKSDNTNVTVLMGLRFNFN